MPLVYLALAFGLTAIFGAGIRSCNLPGNPAPTIPPPPDTESTGAKAIRYGAYAAVGYAGYRIFVKGG